MKDVVYIFLTGDTEPILTHSLPKGGDSLTDSIIRIHNSSVRVAKSTNGVVGESSLVCCHDGSEVLIVGDSFLSHLERVTHERFLMRVCKLWASFMVRRLTYQKDSTNRVGNSKE